ncbi:hypothetical protein NUW58_g329 [Xylaria curta]|uniref:Uncharacterized protein n=1 Tax=Xylaria curta TaxID=42375 RepID=A0ACC1PR09_9PEZI|nr:hypothetical protein NUW58_g329 [Xylaria curta]
MSFGISIGDFLAVFRLVSQVRKRFVGAPEQFKSISDDVRIFSIVLQDVDASSAELSPVQSQEYQSVLTSCKHLLEQLQETLDKYTGVSEANKTGTKTAIKRVWKRLKWEPDDIRDMRGQISVKIGVLRTLNDQAINRSIVKLVHHQEESEREATLKWVSEINYVAQQNDIVLRCQAGSRKWLFESLVYMEWFESLRLANDAETLTIYMFCTYQNHTQTIEKLLCSLLRVALDEADYEAVDVVLTCKQLLDALDELPNEVRRPLINDLLKLHGYKNVSLFITSRGIPEIQRCFEGCAMYTSLEVRSSDEDIRNFLRDNIFQLPNFVARSQQLQDDIIDSITNASAGMRPLSPRELSHALSVDESSEAFDEEKVPDIDDLVAACIGLVVLDDASNIVHLVHKSAAEYFERTKSRWFPRANETMAFVCIRYLQVAEAKPEETQGDQAPFFHYAKANWSYHSMEAEKEAANEAAVDDASQSSSANDSGPSLGIPTISRLAIRQMTKEVVDVHSSIVEACRAGHQAWVEQLLVVRNYDMNMYNKMQEDIIPSDSSFQDDVLLTIATTRGDYSMASMLLARGADPNIFNAAGQTPLMIAADNGFGDLVSLLLDQKLTMPDLMCRHHLGGLSTAFLASIGFGRQECFRILLERSNRGAMDSDGRGAMWLAAASGDSSIVSELHKWPEVVIDYTDTNLSSSPLIEAIKGGHEEAASLLLPYTKYQSCMRCGITPMHYAVKRGFHCLLRRLLEHDASGVDHETNPCDRCSYGITTSVSSLAKSPLLAAVSLQDTQATQILLPYANVNQGLTWQPLHEAAQLGNLEILEILLKKADVEPDPVDENGRTPFLLAARRGYCDVMNALIKHKGILLNRKDAEGCGAVDYVVYPYFRNPYYFRLVASTNEINVNERDSTGSNLLHRACHLCPKISPKFDSKDGPDGFSAELLETNTGPLVAEMLKRPGVDVNLLDRQGKTPLLLAVENHQREVVRLLLEREDTDVLVQDGVGNDALLLASFHVPLCEQLINYKPLKNYVVPLAPPVSHPYNGKDWPVVLNTEFREYDESIFIMLIHNTRTKPDRRNKKGESVMAGVAMTGIKKMVQAVLETTGLAMDLENVYQDGKPLLLLALQKNKDDDAVDHLISHCPAVALQKADTDGRTPLSYAVERANGAATRSLLADPETDPNATDRFGRTTLFFAMGNPCSEPAWLLVTADKTQITTEGWASESPLIIASSLGRTCIISALLKRPDANIFETDDNGHSFLCYLLLCTPHDEGQGPGAAQDEVEDVLKYTLQLLERHTSKVNAYMHSPFTCAFGKRPLPEFSDPRPYSALMGYFHPDLGLSRYCTTPGLLEPLGEGESSDFADNEVHRKVQQLYENRDT